MPDAIITNGDILDINIASLNRESTLIFSQNSNHNNWSHNLETRKIDGYLVDSSGYIEHANYWYHKSFRFNLF